MRPICRGASPNAGEYHPHGLAKGALEARIGLYCSYCEHPLPFVGADIEHIQPKSLPQYAHLGGVWTNFLFACKSCNGCKSTQDVIFANCALPDRDQTFVAFEYHEQAIELSHLLTSSQRLYAQNLLDLVGLSQQSFGRKGPRAKFSAIKLQKKRLEVREKALRASKLLEENPMNERAIDVVIDGVLATGFFSVWMKVFDGNQIVRRRIIDAFPGTRESGCFDEEGKAIWPCPNYDQLAEGGKI
jgi:hypothetical protein